MWECWKLHTLDRVRGHGEPKGLTNPKMAWKLDGETKEPSFESILKQALHMGALPRKSAGEPFFM